MDNEEIRQTLLKMKQELQKLNDLSSEQRQTVKLDQQSVGRLSRMDALQQQAMANAVGERRQNDLIRIEKALTRLEEGDYGYCENCDEEILPKRLEIDPLASRCTRCAAKNG